MDDTAAAWTELIETMDSHELEMLREALARRLAETSLSEGTPCHLLIGAKLIPARVELTIEPGDGLPLKGPRAEVHVGEWPTIRLDPGDALAAAYVAAASDGGTRLAVQIGSRCGLVLRPSVGRTFPRLTFAG